MINRLDHPALSELEQALCTVRSILERNSILLLEEYFHRYPADRTPASRTRENRTNELAEILNRFHRDIELINWRINDTTFRPPLPESAEMEPLLATFASRTPADSEPSSEQSP